MIKTINTKSRNDTCVEKIVREYDEMHRKSEQHSFHSPIFRCTERCKRILLKGNAIHFDVRVLVVCQCV